MWRKMKKTIWVPYSIIKEWIKDTIALIRISRLKMDGNGIIKVGFLAQFPEGWDRMINIYNFMVESPFFSPFLIIVPAYNLIEKRIGRIYGDERKYFEGFIKDNNAIYAYENGKCISLDEYGFDYIIYQRPYDELLPKELKSSAVSRFSRVCYLAYCFSAFGGEHHSYNNSFFRNVYLCFMESQQSADYIKSKTNNRINHIYYTGYPVFEGVKSIKNSFGYKNVLWTPRWTYKGKLGGSHFFEYKDEILKLPEKGFHLVIRPHPLTFSNFISMGYMNEDDVENYKNKIDNIGAVLDTNKEMTSTFDNTDILITDVSSLMIRFLLTGKPVIYCDAGIPLCDVFENMKKCMYIARNWKEVECYINELGRGNDYLKTDRIKWCEDFGKQNNGSSDRIVNIILNDYKRYHYNNFDDSV